MKGNNKAEVIEITVVIPTYNEKDNIRILIPAIADVFSDRHYEIVVVDDGSPDGTAACVEALAKEGFPVRVIKKEIKEGIGAALRVGYDSGRGRVLCSIDADLSFEPEQFSKMYTEIKNGADLVLGSRHRPGGYYEVPNASIWMKYIISRTGNWVVKTFTRMPLNDYSANFRMIKADVWKQIGTREKTNTLLFEMVLKTWVKGFHVTEIPIRFLDRRLGESKLKLPRESVKFLFKFLGFLYQFRDELYLKKSDQKLD